MLAFEGNLGSVSDQILIQLERESKLMTSRPAEATAEVSRETEQSAEVTTAKSRQAARVAYTDVRVKGEAISVPSVEIAGRTVITSGKWLKVAAIQDEELVEGDTVADAELFISHVRESGLNADLFTFAQRLPDVTPKHGYHIEWENAAALSHHKLCTLVESADRVQHQERC